MMMCFVNSVKLFINSVLKCWNSENLREIVEKMIASSIQRNVASYAPDEDEERIGILQGFIDYVHGNLFDEGDITVADVKG